MSKQQSLSVVDKTKIDIDRLEDGCCAAECCGGAAQLADQTLALRAVRLSIISQVKEIKSMLTDLGLNPDFRKDAEETVVRAELVLEQTRYLEKPIKLWYRDLLRPLDQPNELWDAPNALVKDYRILPRVEGDPIGGLFQILEFEINNEKKEMSIFIPRPVNRKLPEKGVQVFCWEVFIAQEENKVMKSLE